MATIHYDRIQGCKGTKDAWGWKDLTKIVIVEGLVGDSTGSWASKVDEAIDTVGIVIGETSFEGMILQSVEANSIEGSPDKAELMCQYDRNSSSDKSFEDNSISFDAGLNSEEVSKDKDGYEATLTYHYDEADTYNPTYVKGPEGEEGKGKDNYKEEVAAIRQVEKPTLSWTVSKRLQMTKAEMKAFVKTYGGAVNNTVWDNNNARTVRCSNIQATNDEPDISGNCWWNCRFVYEYKENTWDNVIRFVKSLSGKTITDEELGASNNAGAEVVTKDYPEVDFTELPTGEE